MAIKFFFEYLNKVVQLPVNPAELTISSPGNNKSEEVIALGEITILRQRKLSNIKIKGFLPKTSDGPYVGTKGAFKAPQFYIDYFQKIRDEKKPCRFIISDIGIDMAVSIEDFEHGLIAGDDDTQFEINLKEYKNYGAKTVKFTADAAGTVKADVTTNSRVPVGYAIGDSVVVNGKYWASSYGTGTFGTFNNFHGKISHVVADTTRKCRYHITTPDGGYRGWVSLSQLAHA